MQIKKNLVRGLTAAGMSVAMLLGTAQAVLAAVNCSPYQQGACGNVAGCTWSNGSCVSTSGSGGTGALGQIERPTGFFDNFATVGSTLLRIVFVFAAILVFGFLVMGGIEWITSGGEKSKTEAARNKITAAIVGLVIIVASWALMNLILSVVTGGKVTDLNGVLNML